MNKIRIYPLLAGMALAFSTSTFALQFPVQKVVLGKLVKVEGKDTLVVEERTGGVHKYQTTAKTEKVGGDPEVGSTVELYLREDGKVDKLEWMK